MLLNWLKFTTDGETKGMEWALSIWFLGLFFAFLFTNACLRLGHDFRCLIFSLIAITRATGGFAF